MFRKGLVILISICCNMSLYCMEELSGFWVNEDVYRVIANNSYQDINYFHVYGNVKQSGYYESNGLRIKNINIDGRNSINENSAGEYDYSLIKKDSDGILIKIDRRRGKFMNWKITKTDDPDRIIIEKENDEAKYEYLRISAPPRIPVVDATINDNDVRLRTKPDLKSDTWAKLGKGTKCKVKDKSKEELEIDGEKWYWYCIDAEGYPDGWVYGKYLDF